jgi:hypothetical protein
MSQGLLEVLAEFFDVIGSQKAHWYRVFDTDSGGGNDLLIQSMFPSLASLMKMESRFTQELLLEAGLMKTKQYRGAYIVYADRSAWDSFIQQYCLEMEITVFEPKKKKYLYQGWSMVKCESSSKNTRQNLEGSSKKRVL